MKGKKQKVILVGVLFLLVMILVYRSVNRSAGVEDYQIIHCQLYEEYTERYPYLDAITLGYVQVDGLKREIQDEINEQIYSSVFKRANYWHYQPDEEVKLLQEDYAIYSDDVNCTPEFHSQYLLSLNFTELYAPYDPVSWTKLTQWGMTFDLVTGQEYGLQDIFLFNEKFYKMWMERAVDREERNEAVLDSIEKWFGGKVKNEEYEIVPFYYVDEEKQFVIGLALNSTAQGIRSERPEDNTMKAAFVFEEIEEFMTDSRFWERYHLSTATGTVVENNHHMENIWLGKEADIWDFWKDRDWEFR